jgi:hypothetical protein
MVSLLFFRTAEATHLEQQNQHPENQQRNSQPEHFNKSSSEATTDISPALHPDSPNDVSGSGTSTSENPPVSSGPGAEAEVIANHGQCIIEPNHVPTSDPAAILRSIRENHRRGFTIIFDEEMLRRYDIPWTEENRRRAEGRNIEGSGSSSSSCLTVSSPPASSPTLASVVGSRAFENGLFLEPALYIYHGRSL